MSCGCQSSSNDLSASFYLGEIKRIKLNIYQPKDGATLEPCQANRNDIVIPITMVVSSPNIKIYNCLDLATILVNDTPAQANIVDSRSQIIGVQLSYSVNTTISPLNAVGDYVAIFSYVVDSAETFMVPFYFSIAEISCLTSSETC